MRNLILFIFISSLWFSCNLRARNHENMLAEKVKEDSVIQDSQIIKNAEQVIVEGKNFESLNSSIEKLKNSFANLEADEDWDVEVDVYYRHTQLDTATIYHYNPLLEGQFKFEQHQSDFINRKMWPEFKCDLKNTHPNARGRRVQRGLSLPRQLANHELLLTVVAYNKE